MVGKEEVIDSLIIAHHYGSLSDVELLCLEQVLTTNDQHQSNYPYRQYRPFNWDQYDEHTCKTELRFEKSDIPRLQRCLGIPHKLQFYKGSYCLGLKALCIILRRLAYPVRYCDMVPRFGRSVPDLCKITHWTINHIVDSHSHLLHSWDSPFLRQEALKSYADAVYAKGAPLKNCFGFVDGTVRPVCRPGKHQKVVYNGHKRVHSIKFQSVVIPNGLIANLAGPWGKFTNILMI